MEQFHQIGEVLGGIKALMVFRDDIQINQRQCSFLLETLISAYDTISDEMRGNLRYSEKNHHARWKILESPLRELCRVYRESEVYMKRCIESQDRWAAKAITLYQNRDCVEFHIHNLLSALPTVIEAIEAAGEMSTITTTTSDGGGVESEEYHRMQKKRMLISRKYCNIWSDPELFQWKFGKQYLVTREFRGKLDDVWKEDRWVLLDKIQEKKRAGGMRKQQGQILSILLKNLNGSDDPNSQLLPSNVLLESKDYQVRRRITTDGQYKEIQWLGESFLLRQIKGETIESLIPDILQLLSLSHPNILQLHCAFADEGRKECFLVTELMSKDLSTFMKELANSKKKVTFSLLAAVDVMLQIARGMEFLHSKRIYHGDLAPGKVLVKSRAEGSGSGLLLAKITGIGINLSSSSNNVNSSKTTNTDVETTPSFIWHAPEVLTEQGEELQKNVKYSEKGDVYSFGMICFEILTGKVPFEDSHLQGDKMSRNIRAGERPLFPSQSYCPKFMTTLVRRCWNADPSQRPNFSSISRVLRYIKRFLVMNPDQCSTDPPPPPPIMFDYYEIEMGFQRKFSSCWKSTVSSSGNRDQIPYPVPEIPFQMFAYRVAEREKLCIGSFRDGSESGSEGGTSVSGDEMVMIMSVTTDDLPPVPAEKRSFIISSPNESVNSSSNNSRRYSVASAKSADSIVKKYPAGGPKLRPPTLQRAHSTNIGAKMRLPNPKLRRKSGHASDSDLP